MPFVHLSDRTVIELGGQDAEHFLQNLVTTDLDGLKPAEARPGALLSPQGKILFDFLVSRAGERLRIDLRTELAEDFVRRLTLYKLRAKVEIDKQDQLLVCACWDGDSVPSCDESSGADAVPEWVRDSRFDSPLNVMRGYLSNGRNSEDRGQWDALRIANGVAESATDFAPGDAFPHDVLLDESGGVGFRKGCYVGQEVVSRMQHRGSARRRVMILDAASQLAGPGTPVEANGRSIGSLGSTAGTRALAILRIDRVRDALDDGHEISAGGVAVIASIPPSAIYRLPEPASGGRDA